MTADRLAAIRARLEAGYDTYAAGGAVADARDLRLAIEDSRVQSEIA